MSDRTVTSSDVGLPTPSVHVQQGECQSVNKVRAGGRAGGLAGWLTVDDRALLVTAREGAVCIGRDRDVGQWQTFLAQLIQPGSCSRVVV